MPMVCQSNIGQNKHAEKTRTRSQTNSSVVRNLAHLGTLIWERPSGNCLKLLMYSMVPNLRPSQPHQPHPPNNKTQQQLCWASRLSPREAHAELPLARVDAAAHHEPVAWLEDVQWASDGRHGHGTNEDGNLRSIGSPFGLPNFTIHHSSTISNLSKDVPQTFIRIHVNGSPRHSWCPIALSRFGLGRVNLRLPLAAPWHFAPLLPVGCVGSGSGKPWKTSTFFSNWANL